MTPQEGDTEQRASVSSGNFAPDYRQIVVSRIGSLFSKIGHADGPINPMEIRTEVETQINELFLDFNFKITDRPTPYSLTQKSGEDVTNTSATLSSGETQTFTLALDIVLVCQMWKLDNIEGKLLIDEPDLHLHPELQQKFAKFIVKLYEQYSYPIIIATHSTTFLSALGQYGKDKANLIYFDNSSILHAKKFDKSLRMLSACLGGHALMGSLFGFPILLVEGDDDYKVWSEIPRHNEIPLSVIPCGGNEIKQYQKTLENLFASLLEPSKKPNGYAMLDGDKGKPGVTQENIRYLNLNCHEIENLYLTNEVLFSMSTNWENACEKVIEESFKYGEKTIILNEIKNWDKKTIDCKLVINELSWILDKQNVPWSKRIGQVLGKGKPQGELADFLGQNIVNAIWNQNINSE